MNKRQSGFRDAQLTADASCRVIIDLAVTGHRGLEATGRIDPYRVSRTFSQWLTPVSPQVAEQILALHGTTTPAGSWDTSELAIRCRKIGSSRSISGSVTAGLGLGIASPRP